MYKTTGVKKSLDFVVESNKALVNSLPTAMTAVVVGGTSGIGEDASYAFAKYVKSPTIYLLGRSEESANRVIKNLREINSSENAKYQFIKTDISSIKLNDLAVSQITSQVDKVNAVIISAGIAGSSTRNENSEGLDIKMSTHYYGRWRIISELVPLLEKSALLGEPATLMSILGPDAYKIAHMDDLELKTHYGLNNVRSHTCTMNNYAVHRFAKKYPNIAFVHLSPGFVKTNLARDMPWYTKYPAVLLMNTFGQPPSSIAEKISYLTLTANNSFLPKGKEWILDCNLRQVILPPFSDSVESTLWNHTELVFNRINSEK